MSNALAVQSNTIAAMLAKSKKALTMALPKHMDADRMARLALTTIRRSKDLLLCSPESLGGAVLESASLGLEIDSRGLAYLVPYKSEATLIIGYKGLMQLAYRSGKIANIYADVVFKKEVEDQKVEITLGDARSIRHDFDIIKSAQLRTESKENPPVLAYAVAVFHDGHRHFEFVTEPEVMKRKAVSKAAEKGFLWNRWIEEAWKKTAIRKLCKYMDLSPEMQRAVTLDEQADGQADGDTKQNFDMADAMDVDFTVQEAPEGDEDPDAKIKAAAEAARASRGTPPTAQNEEITPPAAATVTCPRETEIEGKPTKVFVTACESCDIRPTCPAH